MITCPFMSRPIEKTIREEMLGISMGTTTRYYTEFVKVECMKEDCEAWKVEQSNELVNGQMFPRKSGHCGLIP